MKRIAISLCLAGLLPLTALAQTAAPAKAPAKTAAKKPAAAASAAEPAKPKPRLLTLEQLRKCYGIKDEITAGEAVIKTETAAFEEERTTLLREQAELQTRIDARSASAAAIKAEQAVLLAMAEEYKKPSEKADAAAKDAMLKDYSARAEANGKKIDEFNAGKTPLIETKDKLDLRIEANNAKKRKLKTMVEDHNLAIEEYQGSCINRPFLDADEATVLKERAQKK